MTAPMVFGSALARFAVGLMFDAGISVTLVVGCRLGLSLLREASAKGACGS